METKMTISKMQKLMVKFCKQFDGEWESRSEEFRLYTINDASWCNVYFGSYFGHYTFESPSYEVEVNYDYDSEEIEMRIKGDADELFEQLEEHYDLLVENVRNEIFELF